MSKPKTKEMNELNKNELLACLDEWMKYIKKHLGINSHSFKAYQRIYQIIQNQPEKGRILTGMTGEMFNEAHENQPEVNEEWINTKALQLAKRIEDECGLNKLQRIGLYHLLIEKGDLPDLLQEAGYNVIRKVEIDEKEIDDLVDDVIDIVLQNSYVVSEKTSDGTGRKYYDNQLFPEKGCEERVKKLFQENIIKMKK